MTCPGLVDGSGGGGLSVCLHLLFVANGGAIPQGGVPPGGIVEAFDEAEAGHACLDLRSKAASLEQFAFEGGKEALAQGVIVSVPDRAHRGPYAGFLTALAESQRGILTALVRMMDHVSRPTLAEGHVQGVHNQLGSQMVGHRPADDPAAPDIHDDCRIEEARRGRDVDEILSANSSGTCQSSETRYA